MFLEQLESEIIQKLQKHGIKTISDITIKLSDLNKIRIEGLVAFISPPTSIELQKLDIDEHILLNINYQIYLVIQNLQSNELLKKKFYETIEKLFLEFQKFNTRNVYDSSLNNIRLEDINEDMNLMIYSLNLIIKTTRKEVKAWP